MQDPAKPDRVVLDASVLVKWFNAEEGRDRALLIRDAHMRGRLAVAAPTLAVYEVCNALRFGRIPPKDVVIAYHLLRGLRVDLMEPSEEVMEGTISAAFENDLTVYDAAYLALAENLGAPLVTDDSKMVRCASKGYEVHSLSSDAVLGLTS